MAISTDNGAWYLVYDRCWRSGLGLQASPEVIVGEARDDLITLGEVVNELVWRLDENDENPMAENLQYLAWGGPMGRGHHGAPVVEGLGQLPIEHIGLFELGQQIQLIREALGEKSATTALLAASFLFDFAIAQGYTDGQDNPARWLLGLEFDD